MSLLNKKPIIALTRHSLVVWTEIMQMVWNSWNGKGNQRSDVRKAQV